MSERLSRIIFGFSLAVGALGAGTAWAQDYSAGKTPAQLFQSDCSACHKSPQGLAKGQSMRSLVTFLREHYTTKEESAVALATYLGGTAGDKQKPGAAKPKPEQRPGAVGTAEGEAAPKPAAKPRTASNPAAANPSNPEEKAAEGDAAKPASRSATRAAEPRPATRRAAVPTPPEPVPQADGPREPAAAAETSIMREEPAKPREEAAKPTAQHERTRPARPAVDPTADKLKSYASSGGSALELERSADPGKKLESYATSSTPAPVVNPDAAKDAPPAEAGAAETASPPAAEVKPVAKPKKKNAAASSAAASAPANPPASRPPRTQRRTQAPIQPPLGNN